VIITIDEVDIRELNGDDVVLPGDETEVVVAGASLDNVVDLLPGTIAKKLKKLFSGSDMSVSEIAVQIKVGGSPFGVGIDGVATVKLKPT